MENLGTCKLCLRDGIELRNSHIIPEFNYKPFYDEKGRFFRISTTAHRAKQFLQKGIRERMLCQNCETRFSKWEKYASELLYTGVALTPIRYRWGFLFSGVNYLKFKLYLLSILWRMGASEQKMFSHVNLRLHQESMREILLKEDPSDEDRYPAFLTGVIHNGKLFSNAITQPDLNRDKGIHYYRVLIDGLLYTFCVSSHRIPSDLECFCLRKDGVMRIAIMRLREIPFLYQDLMEIRKTIMRYEKNINSLAF